MQRMPDGSAGRAQGTAASLVNLANVVTFWPAVRGAAGILAGAGPPDRRKRSVLFVAAGLSDALDGWLARRYGGNAIGALMDPVADKALLVTMYITLAAVGELPNVAGDPGGVPRRADRGRHSSYWLCLGHAVTIRPLYISKLNTVLQIVLIGVSLLQGGFGLGIPGLAMLLTWGVVLTTLASGAAYVWNSSRGGLRCRPPTRIRSSPHCRSSSRQRRAPGPD